MASDPQRDGAEGQLGPLDVVLTRRTAAARVTERVVYDHVASATLADDAPIVLFAHGGLVDRARYRWLGVHLASRGYRVVAPEHDADLAILDPSNLLWVLDDLDHRGEVGPTLASGHSLGGVIASWAWEDDPRIAGLALLASFPAGEGPVTGRGAVLSLAGSTDGLSDPAEVRAGAARYDDVTVGIVEGMNHFAWTDDASASELDRDGPLVRELDAVRTDALRLLDTWMDANLLANPAAQDRLARPFPGVSP